jgi:hypothetical protein
MISHQPPGPWWHCLGPVSTAQATGFGCDSRLAQVISAAAAQPLLDVGQRNGQAHGLQRQPNGIPYAL